MKSKIEFCKRPFLCGEITVYSEKNTFFVNVFEVFFLSHPTDTSGKLAKKMMKAKNFKQSDFLELDLMADLLKDINTDLGKCFVNSMENLTHKNHQTFVNLSINLRSQWMLVINKSFENDDVNSIPSTSLMGLFKYVGLQNGLPVPTPQAIGIMLSAAGFSYTKKGNTSMWKLKIKEN